MIAFPHFLFDLAGIDRLNYPEIWQCVGMIVGVYGIGYLLAASDPRTHWPIVLVGLLGKIFGPIGFAAALLRGTFPPLFGCTILTNDLLWWIPFGMILRDAAKRRNVGQRPAAASCSHFVKETRIKAAPEVVFRFHESPDALERLIPPWESMTVAESAGSLAIGSKVVLAGRVLGILPIRWVAVHTEYDPPRMFAESAGIGAFRVVESSPPVCRGRAGRNDLARRGRISSAAGMDRSTVGRVADPAQTRTHVRVPPRNDPADDRIGGVGPRVREGNRPPPDDPDGNVVCGCDS